jgi:hypothetical protein
MQIPIDEELIVARRQPPGYCNFTLATQLGRILDVVERRFGPRDARFTILGVEFHDEAPCIWFPGNPRHVAVQLGTATLGRLGHLVFQLAHECVHLLDPAPGGTNVLEEGVASLFQLQYGNEIDPEGGWSLANPRYEAAALLASALLQFDEDAIRKYRTQHGALREATPARLAAVIPHLPSPLADRLCQPFRY